MGSCTMVLEEIATTGIVNVGVFAMWARCRRGRCADAVEKLVDSRYMGMVGNSEA